MILDDYAAHFLECQEALKNLKKQLLLIEQLCRLWSFRVTAKLLLETRIFFALRSSKELVIMGI